MRIIFLLCLSCIIFTSTAQKKYNNRILVVGGGGARGAWGAGFAKYLDSIYGGYRIVYGTSTGSLMAPLIVLGQFEKLEEAYTSVKQESIFDKNPFKMTARKQKIKMFSFLGRTIAKRKTVGESNNLLSLIHEFVDSTSYNVIRNSKDSLEIGVSVVDFKTGEFYLKSSRDYNYDQFTKWMWGSSNQPVFMSYTQIDSSYYVDGGVRQTIPLEVAVKYALSNNIDAIDVVINKPMNPLTDTSFVPKNIFSSLGRLIDIWKVQIMNDNLIIGRLLAELGKAQIDNTASRGNNVVQPKFLEINYYYFPPELFNEYKNELIFDKEKMKQLWIAGAHGVKDVSTSARGAEKPVRIPIETLKILKQYQD